MCLVPKTPNALPKGHSISKQSNNMKLLLKFHHHFSKWMQLLCHWLTQQGLTELQTAELLRPLWHLPVAAGVCLGNNATGDTARSMKKCFLTEENAGFFWIYQMRIFCSSAINLVNPNTFSRTVPIPSTPHLKPWARISWRLPVLVISYKHKVLEVRLFFTLGSHRSSYSAEIKQWLPT